MPNLWGIPLWEFLLSAAVVLGWTWWRVRQGAVGGPLSVTLSALSTGGECAAFFVTASPLFPSLLGFQLIGALTLGEADQEVSETTERGDRKEKRARQKKRAR